MTDYNDYDYLMKPVQSRQNTKICDPNMVGGDKAPSRYGPYGPYVPDVRGPVNSLDSSGLAATCRLSHNFVLVSLFINR